MVFKKLKDEIHSDILLLSWIEVLKNIPIIQEENVKKFKIAACKIIKIVIEVNKA